MSQEDKISVKWLEDKLDPSELDDLSNVSNLKRLDNDLRFLSDLQLNTKPIDEQWKAFNEKINALKLEFS